MPPRLEIKDRTLHDLTIALARTIKTADTPEQGRRRMAAVIRARTGRTQLDPLANADRGREGRLAIV